MKKLIILVVFAGISITIFGQTKKGQSGDFFNRNVSFGILTGIGHSAFRVKESNWNQTNLKDTFNSLNPSSGLVVILGSEVKCRINNFLAYRQRFLLNFENTKLNFDTKKNGQQKLNFENVVIAAPMHFVFQSSYKNRRPFIFLGSTLKLNLGKEKELEEKFQLNLFDMTADLGLGVEIKMKKFLIAPELLFSQGLLNINKNIGTSYSNTISKLNRRSIILGIAIR